MDESTNDTQKSNYFTSSVPRKMRESLLHSNGKMSMKTLSDSKSLADWSKHNHVLMAEEIFIDSHVRHWEYQIDFLLSFLAFSIGLGNLWRFPLIAITYGTYAFILAYVVIVIFIVIPLIFIEVYIGQFTSRSIGACWNVAPGFFGIGVSMILLNVLYSLYYYVVSGWILFYVINSLHLDINEIPFMNCNNLWNDNRCLGRENRNFTTVKNSTGEPAGMQFWYRFITLIQDKDGNSANPISFVPGYITWYTCTCTLLTYTICCTIMMRYSSLSLSKMDVFFILLFVLLVITYSLSFILTLDVITELKYWLHTLENISNPSLWCQAAIQACFSFGIGFGNVLNLRRHSQFRHRISFLLMTGVLMNLLIAIVYTMKISVNIRLINTYYNISLEKSSPLNLLGLVFISIDEHNFGKYPQLYFITYYSFLFIVSFKALHFIGDTAISGLIDIFPSLATTKYHKLCFIFLFVWTCSFFSLIFVTRCGYQWFKLVFIYGTSSNILIVAALKIIVFIYMYGTININRDILMMVPSKINLLFQLQLRITPFILIAVVILEWIFAIWNDEVSMFNNDLSKWAKSVGFCLYFGILLPIPCVFIYQFIHHSNPKTSQLKTLQDLFKPNMKWGPLKKANWLNDPVYRIKLAYLRDFNVEMEAGEDLEDVLYQPAWMKERLKSRELVI